jgi:hypothetical protein
MKISKAKETFNDYKVELSWGQLNAIYKALEQDHADPLADELFAELGWYLENVPGPGEDEEEYKEAKDAEKEAQQLGDEGAYGEGGRDLDQIGQEVGDDGQELPPEGLEGTEPPVDSAREEPGPGEAGEPARERPQREADELLERPPRHEAPARRRSAVAA